MTLHTDWTDAKKDSKAKFKLALKAKRDALEKQIKEGDAKAKAKMLEKNLADLGLGGVQDDVDKYYTFKEDFGPTLDKLQKTIVADSAGKPAASSITTIEQVLADPKLTKALGAVAKRMHMDDFFQFVTAGYKLDPVKAYALFIKDGAPLELNLDGTQLAALRAIGTDAKKLKAEGPALLLHARRDLLVAVGRDALMKFKGSAEGQAVMSSGTPSAAVTALKTKLAATSASYRRAITASASKWAGIQPDFRKPLLDALTAIDAALA